MEKENEEKWLEILVLNLCTTGSSKNYSASIYFAQYRRVRSAAGQNITAEIKI